MEFISFQIRVRFCFCLFVVKQHCYIFENLLHMSEGVLQLSDLNPYLLKMLYIIYTPFCSDFINLSVYYYTQVHCFSPMKHCEIWQTT